MPGKLANYVFGIKSSELAVFPAYDYKLGEIVQCNYHKAYQTIKNICLSKLWVQSALFELFLRACGSQRNI